MSPDRRTFIKTVGAGCVAGLAGCPGGGGGNDTDTSSDQTGGGDTPTETADGTEGQSTPTSTATDDGPPDDVSGPTVITMEAGGVDIWNSTDLGHIYYTEHSGDFDVSVELTSLENTNPHAKAGLMARASLDSPARNVMVRRRPGFGTSPQWRPADNSSTTSTTSEEGAPLSRIDSGYVEDHPWQRLERVGDTIRAYASQDGEDWTLMVELGADQIELPDTVILGIAATSHDQANATTAKFRNYDGPELTDNQDLGAPLVGGNVSVAQPAVVADVGADASPESATLQGTLQSTGGADSVDVWFQYREATEEEWTETDPTSVSEGEDIGVDVSGLTPRRYYEIQAFNDNGETESNTVATFFSTPSGSDGSSDSGPESASQFDPADGYADFASWVDDDTPLVVVDEPTRAAVETATSIPGPRIIVFETSGTIDLGAQNLNVRNDQCWIAGQTAPSPGITLIRGGVWIYGNDCVIQHVRVRPGTAGQEQGWQPDAIEIADDTQGNVVDHCTGTWGVDENINVGYDTNNSTLSNCLMAEPLNEATHEKGAHGYNSIIGDRAKNVTWMGNVSALGTDRNPRLKQGTEVAVVNNFVHHYHDGMWADPDTQHSIVGNVFEGPQTDQPNIFGEGSVYSEDNVQRDDASNPMVGNEIQELDSRPHFPEDLSAISSSEVRSHNLSNAGARPGDRTETDQRIIEAVRNGDGGVIDNQDDVGGYPDLAQNTEELSPPTSGLLAWLREQAVAVEP